MLHQEVQQMSHNVSKSIISKVDKLIDFGKQLFASILRSRKGVLSEFARLSRFQTGTKGFEREFKRLEPIRDMLFAVYQKKVLEELPQEGLTYGMIDDSPLKKWGKQFPKQKDKYDHCTNSFYNGMKLLSSTIYCKGKLATMSSELVGKENKLEKAKEIVDLLLSVVDIFLF